MKKPRVILNLVQGMSVRRHGHFAHNAISMLIFLGILALGLGLEYAVTGRLNQTAAGYLIAGSISGISILIILPWWPVVLIAIGGIWGAAMTTAPDMVIFPALISLGLLITPGFMVVTQWDKVVVLRLGRFYRVKGPGLVYLVPLIDTIAGVVDTRIRVTDFSAEKSLTLDTVPVHIDALAFWMIWDAQKAVLEVQNFEEAVVLSAQTALRSTTGSNSLTSLLCERDRLGREIQGIVDAKTNPWGITIISVEFKEILVPKDLEDALSREAQAERESKARTILGNAEADISKLYADAAETYEGNHTALNLRAMNMIYESMRNKGGLVLTPASALESMNLGAVLGTVAYAKKTHIGEEPAVVSMKGDEPESNTEQLKNEIKNEINEGEKNDID